jgi:hypothetical protein
MGIFHVAGFFKGVTDLFQIGDGPPEQDLEEKGGGNVKEHILIPPGSAGKLFRRSNRYSGHHHPP